MASVLALALHVGTSLGWALHVTVLQETFDVERKDNEQWVNATGLPIPRRRDHGCTITGTRVTYQCNEARVEPGDHNGTVPQLLSFRVDCRGGKVQNMTLYQSSRQCHRMSYRRISKSRRNSSHPVAFVADHAVTLHKEEVVDIQCIMRPFNFHETFFTHETTTGKVYGVEFKMVLDGRLEEWQNIFKPILLETSAKTAPCLTYLEEKYDWNMELVKSVNSTRHVVSYSSPLLEVKDLFPKMDFGDYVMESGEFFEASESFYQR
eukprot:Skav225859  [mRNA]  locus=scaffold810:51314:52105:+ [translate_table: standard]